MLLLAQVACGWAANGPDLRINRSNEFISIEKKSGGEVLRYWLQKPPESSLAVQSAAFFHPLTTPKGVVVTDLAPADHPHHRGVFLGWVEMHGEVDADFWGWGEHAPTNGRRIVNRRAAGFRTKANRAAFSVENAWLAGKEIMLVERMQMAFRAGDDANILDLSYRITPSETTTLSQWAFSGFCVRTVKEGTVTAFGPKGKVELPNPIHTKPESDWPDESWYAFSLKLPDGEEAGVAVVNHPENPPTLWHNHREVRMLNPCIVAPGQVELKRHKRLTLRYRVVAFDGTVPADLLNELAADWSKVP